MRAAPIGLLLLVALAACASARPFGEWPEDILSAVKVSGGHPRPRNAANIYILRIPIQNLTVDCNQATVFRIRHASVFPV